VAFGGLRDHKRRCHRVRHLAERVEARRVGWLGTFERMFLLAIGGLLIAGLAVIAIRIARAVPWPAALPIRHCSLIAWTGVAVITLSVFLPWWKVTIPTDGQRSVVRAEASMPEDLPLALVPLAVGILWLLRPKQSVVHLAFVAAATGVGLVLVVELWIAALNSTLSDERHHAEIGMHLLLIGYVVLTLATAAAERTMLRNRADSAN
jgi:formate hydrogenlyase subunit 3/multisubunit Na+/H+ antiporter MnhD subunit